MVKRHFHQLDVITDKPYTGNPLAVVHDAQDLGNQITGFAHWAKRSETTFLLPPADPAADDRVRIVTPGGKLPFAGHPTPGSYTVCSRRAASRARTGMAAEAHPA